MDSYRIHSGQVFNIGFNRHQTLARRQPFERFAQVFTDYAFNLIRIFNNGIQRTVLLQPFHRRFGPDFGHARNVIDRIAH